MTALPCLQVAVKGGCRSLTCKTAKRLAAMLLLQIQSMAFSFTPSYHWQPQHQVNSSDMRTANVARENPVNHHHA